MLLESPSMLFPLEKCDPEEISWQLSLGHTALDKVANPEFAGLTAVECCLAMIVRSHQQDDSDSGKPDAMEEKSLRLLVEDAVGDPSFQTDLLPKLVHEAIEAENLPVVEILLSYSTNQGLALKIANAHPGDVVDPDEGRHEATGQIVVNEGDDYPEDAEAGGTGKEAGEKPAAPAEASEPQSAAPDKSAEPAEPAETDAPMDPALSIPAPCPRL
ncbi:MAG: hypothetical protein K6E40_00805 [Desulfovibrio sp.]|nr:hypothetical protein [Desulfovibrio sp.]